MPPAAVPPLAAGSSDGRPRNRLLAALPPEDYQAIQPHLTAVTSKPRQTLYRCGQPVVDLYFPESGVYSIVTELTDGTMIESAMVGFEGVLGVEALLRPRAGAFGHAMLQVPTGAAQRLNAGICRRLAADSSVLTELLGRSLEAVVAQMLRSLACQVCHTTEARCCGWLLMVHDRMQSTGFALTHEFLAMMIGARRQTVTTVATTLQRAGIIQYKHGRITGLDRQGLEQRACECYEAQRLLVETLFAHRQPPDTVSC